MCVCVHVCVCVCVCERERERESLCVCVCVRGRKSVWAVDNMGRAFRVRWEEVPDAHALFEVTFPSDKEPPWKVSRTFAWP